MNNFGFGPVFKNEQIVFGTQRPGYNSKSVSVSDIQKWISFIKKQEVKRICCLFLQSQLEVLSGEPLRHIL